MQYLHSINSFNEAKQVIPGGVNSPVRSFRSVGGNPPFIQSAKGYELIDIDGNHYVDFVQSWGPLIFGHADQEIESAVIQAVKNGLSFGAPTQKETALAKQIIKMTEGIDKIRLVSSGTEAVMSAIRLARGYSKKDDILKFDGCYHGHSDSLLVNAGSGCITFGNPSSPGIPQDLSKHTYVARYNDIESVKKCFERGNIGCVIIEPIAGNMGLVPADSEFLIELRKICDQYHAVLIFDEVMSGFRAWSNGINHFSPVIADLYTFGKVIGGGMPLAAFGGRDEIMKLLSPSGPIYQAGTLSGNPVAVSAGLMALLKIESNPKIYQELEILALRLTQGIKEAAHEFGFKVQTCVRGSMFGFFFNENEVKNFDNAKKSNLDLFGKFHQAMLDRGVYFACSQFETGFICTPMTQNLIDSVIQKAFEAFEEIYAMG